MSITTYAELQTAVAAWCERTGDAVFEAQVPTFIELAESTMSKKIRHHELDGADTITLDANGYGDLPADFVTMQSAYYDSGTKRVLKPLSFGDMVALNTTGMGGSPNFYAITGGQIYSPSAADGDIVIKYSKKIPALTDSNTTNWLLELAPEAYLYFASAQGAIFNEDNAAASRWAGLGFDALTDIRKASEVAQYGGAGMRFKVVV